MNKLIADLQRDQLRNSPIYKERELIVVIGAANPSLAPAEAPTTAPPASVRAPEPIMPTEKP